MQYVRREFLQRLGVWIGALFSGIGSVVAASVKDPPADDWQPFGGRRYPHLIPEAVKSLIVFRVPDRLVYKLVIWRSPITKPEAFEVYRQWPVPIQQQTMGVYLRGVPDMAVFAYTFIGPGQSVKEAGSFDLRVFDPFDFQATATRSADIQSIGLMDNGADFRTISPARDRQLGQEKGN